MKSRLLAAAGALTLAAAAGVLTAPAASADQIWYQGVGRATAQAACPTNTAADTEAGWTEWTASWEDWPNHGAGGYVCTRQNTWAQESTGEDGYPSAGCVPTTTLGGPYLDFLGGWSLPTGTAGFNDRDCANISPEFAQFNLVFAPSGAEQASALCQHAFGVSNTFRTTTWGPSLYGCVA